MFLSKWECNLRTRFLGVLLCFFSAIQVQMGHPAKQTKPKEKKMLQSLSKLFQIRSTLPNCD